VVAVSFARGGSYREFADFVDRLEHGERLVRVEKLRMEKQQTAISLTCLIRGLVKSNAKPSSTPAGKPTGAPAAATAGDTLPDVIVGPQLPDELKPTPDEDGDD